MYPLPGSDPGPAPSPRPLSTGERAPALLALRDVSKTYPGVLALERVSIAFRPGEVLGLIGENGAGKSTLLKILGGVVTPSSGEIVLDGVRRVRLTVQDSLAGGIAFVHQELNLFDNLDVKANIWIGREPLRGGPLRLVDSVTMRARSRAVLGQLGVDFGPDTPVAALSLAQRQLLEIAKALSLEARLLILDEPTSSLTLAETDRLVAVIRRLKEDGVSVVFVTHRLHELMACADRVVALRDGRVVGELEGPAILHDTMIRLMVGRDLKSLFTPPARPPGETRLALDGVLTAAWPDRPVDLAVRGGEILGLAGLIGAGRTELARTLFGIDVPRGGRILLDGAELPHGGPRDAIARGIHLVPEDRKRCGVVLPMAIGENIVLPDLPAQGAGATGLVDKRKVTTVAEGQKRSLDIRAPSIAVQAGSLSGGNQQKVALAKWLALAPKVLICDEPTRGVDVGAKAEIYAILRALADSGVAVMLISSDMEEVIGVSDRIAVMHEGRIGGILERPAFSEQAVLRLAVGETV